MEILRTKALRTTLTVLPLSKLLGLGLGEGIVEGQDVSYLRSNDIRNIEGEV